MSGFRWEHQDELMRQYTDKYFEVVRSVFKNREKEFANAFFGSVSSSNIIGITSDRQPHLQRNLLENADF